MLLKVVVLLVLMVDLLEDYHLHYNRNHILQIFNFKQRYHLHIKNLARVMGYMYK
jgi:hypothetical protein